MIESLKLPNINVDKLQTIEHVNSWWDKKLEKLIKKHGKWIAKFNQSPTDYFQTTNFAINEYDRLFKNTNNYLNFYNQKMDLIVKNKKIFKKFEKMIVDYVALLGLTHSINLMMDYYVDLDTKPIENKKNHALELANSLIMKTYQRYKREIKKCFPPQANEVLTQIYRNEKIIALDLFNPLLIFNLILKYANKLNQIKELNDESLVQIVYLTVLSANFINNYAFASAEFINKIN